jgi:pimeloyl-ACP methyl ester carboxylesterase
VKERRAGRHSVADKELTLGPDMTTTRDHDLQLADGRVLRYQIAGTTHGDPIFLLHGALGSRLVDDALSAAAADAGIRLVSYDRPGYGGSTPHPGRTVAAAAADVAAIADQLDVGRLAVWGQSAGGPSALACAALLPDRVAAAAVVAPLAPYQAPALEWFAGMAHDVAQMHRLAVAGCDALQQVMPQLADALTSTDVARFVEFSSPTLPAPDQAILKTDAAAHLFANLREGLAPRGGGRHRGRAGPGRPLGDRPRQRARPGQPLVRRTGHRHPGRACPLACHRHPRRRTASVPGGGPPVAGLRARAGGPRLACTAAP